MRKGIAPFCDEFANDSLIIDKWFLLHDGSGYSLFVDAVIAIDPHNPQLAARLLTSLRAWRTLEPVRRGLAEEALRKVAAVPALSSDTNDIATRALG